MTVDIDLRHTRSNADLLAARVTTAGELATALLAVDRLVSVGYTTTTRTLLGEYQSEVGDASTLMHAVADSSEISDATDWTGVLNEEWWSTYGDTLDRLHRSVRDSSGHQVTDADVREYYERITGNGDGGGLFDPLDPSAAATAAATLEDIDSENIDNYWDSLPKWLQDQIAEQEPGTFVDTVLGSGLPVTPGQLSAIAENPEYEDEVTKFLDAGGVVKVGEPGANTATQTAIIALNGLSGPALLLYWESLSRGTRSLVLGRDSQLADRLVDANARFTPEELEQIGGVVDESGEVVLSSVLADPDAAAGRLAALATAGDIGGQVEVLLVDGSSVVIKLAKFATGAAGVLSVVANCEHGGDACAAAVTMFVVDTAGSALLTPIGWAALKQLAAVALPHVQGPDVPTPQTVWPNDNPPGQLPYDTSRGPVVEYEPTRNGANPSGTVTYGN